MLPGVVAHLRKRVGPVEMGPELLGTVWDPCAFWLSKVGKSDSPACSHIKEAREPFVAQGEGGRGKPMAWRPVAVPASTRFFPQTTEGRLYWVLERPTD